MTINTSTIFTIQISGIFLLMGGLFIPVMPWGVTLIVWGVIFLILSPMLALWRATT